MSRRTHSRVWAKAGPMTWPGETLTAMLGTAIPALWHWQGLAGLAQHPLAEGQDHAGPLGAGDHDVGHDAAAVGVVPAQRALLCAAHPAPLLVPDGQLP